jgi:hypothetical protein
VDIVRRAYAQAREELEKAHSKDPAIAHPYGFTVAELDALMIKNMVRWIVLRAYPRRDWPSRQFGPYPKHLEVEVKN